MTKRQREALKLALFWLGVQEAEYRGSDRMAETYRQIVAAMQTIEEMLRGEQGELGI